MSWILFPFAIIYGIIVSIRNRLYNHGVIKSHKFDIPVISIGNLSVGGTGKTPHSEYLIKQLKDLKDIAVLSRGYKRKTKGFFEVKTDSTVLEVGDEPLQMKRKYPDVTVTVDEDRVHGINELLNRKKSPDIVILDDAYQHRRVKPSYSILLTDYNRLFTKDYLLPVGRLRERSHNKKRANCIIVTKCPDNLTPLDFRILQKELDLYPYQSLFFTTFSYLNLKPFNVAKDEMSIKSLKGREVIVVTGIANPKILYKQLQAKGANIHKMAYADHHNFSSGDIKDIANKYKLLEGKKPLVVLTEKDATRLKGQLKGSPLEKIALYYLPIEVKFLNGGEADFLCYLKGAAQA